MATLGHSVLHLPRPIFMSPFVYLRLPLIISWPCFSILTFHSPLFFSSTLRHLFFSRLSTSLSLSLKPFNFFMFPTLSFPFLRSAPIPFLSPSFSGASFPPTVSLPPLSLSLLFFQVPSLVFSFSPFCIYSLPSSFLCFLTYLQAFLFILLFLSLCPLGFSCNSNCSLPFLFPSCRRLVSFISLLFLVSPFPCLFLPHFPFCFHSSSSTPSFFPSSFPFLLFSFSKLLFLL